MVDHPSSVGHIAGFEIGLRQHSQGLGIRTPVVDMDFVEPGVAVDRELRADPSNLVGVIADLNEIVSAATVDFRCRADRLDIHGVVVSLAVDHDSTRGSFDMDGVRAAAGLDRRPRGGGVDCERILAAAQANFDVVQTRPGDQQARRQQARECAEVCDRLVVQRDGNRCAGTAAVHDQRIMVAIQTGLVDFEGTRADDQLQAIDLEGRPGIVRGIVDRRSGAGSVVIDARDGERIPGADLQRLAVVPDQRRGVVVGRGENSVGRRLGGLPTLLVEVQRNCETAGVAVVDHHRWIPDPRGLVLVRVQIQSHPGALVIP